MNRYKYYIFLILSYTSAIIFGKAQLPSSNKESDQIFIVTDSSLFLPNKVSYDTLKLWQFSFEDETKLKTGDFNLYPDDSIAIFSTDPLFIQPLGEGGISSCKVYPGEHILISMNDNGNFVYSNRNTDQRAKELSSQTILDSSIYHIIDDAKFKAYWEKYLTLGDTDLVKREILQFVDSIVVGQNSFLDSISVIYALDRTIVNAWSSKIKIDSFTRMQKYEEYYFINRNNETQYLDYLRKQSVLLSSLCEDHAMYPYANYAFELFEKIRTLKKVHWIARDFNSFKDQYNLIEEYFRGKPREFLLSWAIYEATKRNIAVPQSYFNDYFKSCIDKKNAAIIQKMIQAKELRNSETSDPQYNIIEGNDRKRMTITQLIKENNGKLILLDFWATWCGPCKEEFPAMKKLITKYKNKNVIFSSISLDNDIDKWRTLENLNPVDVNNSYVLLNLKMSEFIKKYKIETIPRYLLIGKSGNIISQNAPRPSDPALIKLINENL